MELYGKGLLSSLFLISGSSATAIWVGGSTWSKNNPVAKTWLSDNHFSPKKKEEIVGFVSTPNKGWFALGCHKTIFGGQNFKKLYDNSKLSDTSDQNAVDNEGKSELPISDLFKDNSEPLLGCSTAFLTIDTENQNKKVYQYELALRQGDKGFDERISVYEDKIISQLVFYEKKQQDNLAQKPAYKHLFGLYRYINQQQITGTQKTYKVANPNPSNDFLEEWSEIDVGKDTKETTSRYYAFWVDDSNGKGIFDNLGIKSNGKLFSSVSREKHNSSTNVSDFVYTNRKKTDNNDELESASSTNLVHYDLSVLDSLVKRIYDKKGFWKPAAEFCSSEVSEGGRQHILEVKRLSQYCYEIKGETTTKPNSR